MTISTAPTRIDGDLFAAAQVVGPTMSRSAAQQVNHWARVGRAVEESESISAAEIVAVLAGTQEYDSLDDKAQAIVRALWDERSAALRSNLDLADQFAAEGRSYVELDDDGNVVVRGGDDPATVTG